MLPDPPVPADLKTWACRTFAIGRVRLEGSVRRTAHFRFDYPAGDVRAGLAWALGSSDNCVWLFLDDNPEPAGWAPAQRIQRLARPGERVAVWVHPADRFIGRIKPLDRTGKWWKG